MAQLSTFRGRGDALFEFPDLLLEPVNISDKVADMSSHPVTRLVLSRCFDPNLVIGFELFGLDFRLCISFHVSVFMILFTTPNKSPERTRVVACLVIHGVLVAGRSALAVRRHRRAA